jgi:DNA repair photolyase
MVLYNAVSISEEWEPMFRRYESGNARAHAVRLYRPASDGGVEVREDAVAVFGQSLPGVLDRQGPVVFGFDGEPYPTDELGHRVMRGCLEICVAREVPTVVLTRSPLIERDLDLLRRLAGGPGVHVAIGLTMLDGDHARKFEPQVPSPARRLETIRTLARAGVPVVVSVAPAVWGLTDTDLVRLMSAAVEAGASAAFYRRLELEPDRARRLLAHVKRVLPARASRVAAGLKARIGPTDNADPMRQIFEFTAARLEVPALADAPWPASGPLRIEPREQLQLFGEEVEIAAPLPVDLPIM